MIPKLQMSILGVDSLKPIKTSGGIYFKLPALLFSGAAPRFEPKIPKSTIFNSIFFLLYVETLVLSDEIFSA